MGFEQLEDIFSIVHTNLPVWLNILCLGAKDVSAEQRKSGRRKSENDCTELIEITVYVSTSYKRRDYFVNDRQRTKSCPCPRHEGIQGGAEVYVHPFLTTSALHGS